MCVCVCVVAATIAWFVTFAPDSASDLVISVYAGHFGLQCGINGPFNAASLPTPAQRFKMAHVDPVASARRFERQVEIFLHDIIGFDTEHQQPLAGGGAFGYVRGYALFVEEQRRGALHAHAVVFPLLPQRQLLPPTASAQDKQHLQQFVESVCRVNMPVDLNVCGSCSAAGTLERNADCNVTLARTRAAQRLPEPELARCNACNVTCTSSALIDAAVARLAARYETQHGAPFDLRTYLDATVPLPLPTADDLSRLLVLCQLRQKCNRHKYKHFPQCFKSEHADCACRYLFPLELESASKFTDEMRLLRRRTIGNEYINKANEVVQWLFRCNNDVR
jgi:hypothetical protein